MLTFLKKRWYVFVIIIFVIFFSYQKIAPSKTNKVKSYTIKKQTLKETLSLSGKVDADEKVTLRFQTSGRLIWVGVKEGDYVKKYQSIASLDKREVRKKLEKALRDYSKERNDFEEDKQVTYKNGALTDTIKRVLEKNQFDLDKAVLDVEIQDLANEYSNLFTPIEGLVTKVGSPYGGVNIIPTQAEFEIVNPKTVYFSGLADQTDVVKLRPDEKGEITLDAFPDKTIEGQIKSTAFTPKEGETGTVYEIKLYFNKSNDDFLFRLGMTGDVAFTIREKPEAIAIPAEFIKSDNRKKYVMKKNRGSNVRQDIKVGDSFDNVIEITSGLQEGDVIYD